MKESFAGVELNKLSTLKAKPTSTTKIKRSPGTTQSLTSVQQFPQKLWTALEWLFTEKIFSCWKQVNFLNKCLKKVSQHPTNVGLLQTVNIEKNFNERLFNLLKKSFTDCAAHVKQCLVKDLPKLLQLCRQLQSKCENRFFLRYG